MYFILNPITLAPQELKLLHKNSHKKYYTKCAHHNITNGTVKSNKDNMHLAGFSHFPEEFNLLLKLWDYKHCSPSCSQT